MQPGVARVFIFSSNPLGEQFERPLVKATSFGSGLGCGIAGSIAR
jgi:hypothetical protein